VPVKPRSALISGAFWSFFTFEHTNVDLANHELGATESGPAPRLRGAAGAATRKANGRGAHPASVTSSAR
jgi:hypothetical protein